MSEFKVLQTVSVKKFQKLMGGEKLDYEEYDWLNPETGQTQVVRHLLCGEDRVGVISKKVDNPLDETLVVNNIQFTDGDVQWVLCKRGGDNRRFTILEAII